MSDETAGATVQDPTTDVTPKLVGLGYVIYQQVAGVLGAFALIAFISHFWPLDILWMCRNVAKGFDQLRSQSSARLFVGDILSLSPIFYLVLLLAANYLLLKPGT